MTTLPQWLLDELPEVREIEYIDFKDGKWIFRDEEFDTAEDAYDASEKRENNVDFSKAARENFPGKIMRNLFLMEGRIKDATRGLLIRNDSHKLQSLVYEYESWLGLNDRYQANPDDWVTAYQWVEHHPAFWIKAKTRRNENADKTWDWNTSNGIADLWTCVAINDAGDPVVMLEGGGHVTENFTMCYHDHDLDVWGKNFEDAYIQYAKLVNKYFFPDGTERPGMRTGRDD